MRSRKTRKQLTLYLGHVDVYPENPLVRCEVERDTKDSQSLLFVVE